MDDTADNRIYDIRLSRLRINVVRLQVAGHANPHRHVCPPTEARTAEEGEGRRCDSSRCRGTEATAQVRRLG